MIDDTIDHDTREQAKEIIEGQEYLGRIREANKAIARVTGRTEKNFADWWIIAEGFLEIRHAASVMTGTDDIQNPNYKKQFSALVGRTKLTVVDAVTRSKLMDLAVHRRDVDLWWSTLTPEQRLKWSHPTTVWKNWKAANKPKKPFPDTKGKKTDEFEPSTMEEVDAALGFAPLDTVRIGADAGRNVAAILKVTAALALDDDQRAALLADMGSGLAAAARGKP